MVYKLDGALQKIKFEYDTEFKRNECIEKRKRFYYFGIKLYIGMIVLGIVLELLALCWLPQVMSRGGVFFEVVIRIVIGLCLFTGVFVCIIPGICMLTRELLRQMMHGDNWIANNYFQRRQVKTLKEEKQESDERLAELSQAIIQLELKIEKCKSEEMEV